MTEQTFTEKQFEKCADLLLKGEVGAHTRLAAVSLLRYAAQLVRELEMRQVSEVISIGFRSRIKDSNTKWVYNFARDPDSYELRDCEIEAVSLGNAPQVDDETFTRRFFDRLRELADYDDADESGGVMEDCWHASSRNLDDSIQCALIAFINHRKENGNG